MLQNIFSCIPLVIILLGLERLPVGHWILPLGHLVRCWNMLGFFYLLFWWCSHGCSILIPGFGNSQLSLFTCGLSTSQASWLKHQYEPSHINNLCFLQAQKWAALYKVCVLLWCQGLHAKLIQWKAVMKFLIQVIGS